MKCIKVLPYRVAERRFLDFHQVLPLKEAGEYQVKIRKKDESIRRTATGSSGSEH